MMTDDQIKEFDPVKIGVPEALHRLLVRDAERFEVFKGKDEKTDLNRFLNKLVCGYIEDYKKELFREAKTYRDILSPYIKDPEELEEAVRQLSEKGRADSLKISKADTKIRFRPTQETIGIIPDVEKQIQRTNESLSGYFRRMLYRYSIKPGYDRERIIYFNTAHTLDKAFREKNGISFVFQDSRTTPHYVKPYKLVHGTDEQYNYLLCQEYNEKANQLTAVSYRLCRIVNPHCIISDQPFDDTVLRHLKKMEVYGPPYNINEDVETCVEFTPEGRKNYRRIYQGRPIFDRIESEDNGKAKYYFSCSQDQLFLYFRRFNPGDASILCPESLKQRLYDFHRDHLDEIKIQNV